MNCHFCNAEFDPVGNQIICSPECEKFKTDKYRYVEPDHKYYTAARRAKMKRGDKIVPLIVFEMYDWVCSICGIKIDSSLRQPHAMCATVDHVQPLSGSGRHTWENVAPAHGACNFKKSNSNLK